MFAFTRWSISAIGLSRLILVSTVTRASCQKANYRLAASLYFVITGDYGVSGSSEFSDSYSERDRIEAGES